MKKPFAGVRFVGHPFAFALILETVVSLVFEACSPRLDVNCGMRYSRIYACGSESANLPGIRFAALVAGSGLSQVVFTLTQVRA